MDAIETLLDLMNRMGAIRYGSEPVPQLDHALQCAALAEREGASSQLVAAALLHDIGHLTADDEGAALRGVDARHEIDGSGFLAAWFGGEVTRPVRLHVDAKRYLCAVDPAYFDGLSPASVRSLALQGGPFSAHEAQRFIAQAQASEAMRLRRWDDGAKVPGAATPPLSHYRLHLEEALAARR
ncbi:MAG: HD domain-containing protein [Alphaproteobacteria bacterium]|nr:HD domain-containing protein [Alphaproteobacteria bacterium]